MFCSGWFYDVMFNFKVWFNVHYIGTFIIMIRVVKGLFSGVWEMVSMSLFGEIDSIVGSISVMVLGLMEMCKVIMPMEWWIQIMIS